MAGGRLALSAAPGIEADITSYRSAKLLSPAFGESQWEVMGEDDEGCSEDTKQKEDLPPIDRGFHSNPSSPSPWNAPKKIFTLRTFGRYWGVYDGGK